MGAYASKPVNVNWLMRMPSRNKYLHAQDLGMNVNTVNCSMLRRHTHKAQDAPSNRPTTPLLLPPLLRGEMAQHFCSLAN